MIKSFSVIFTSLVLILSILIPSSFFLVTNASCIAIPSVYDNENSETNEKEESDIEEDVEESDIEEDVEESENFFYQSNHTYVLNIVLKSTRIICLNNSYLNFFFEINLPPPKGK